jgi:peptide/nickel transport system permease protein
MIAYLIRRVFQMILVLFVAALVTYVLFSIVGGPPTKGEGQQKQTPQDRARLRAKYELDLYWPVRFSRWLTGIPSGPLMIGGREWFARVPMGCYLYAGDDVTCEQYVYLADIPKIHPDIKSSKGIVRGDFGLSTVIKQGRPVSELISSRMWPTLELMITSTLLSLLIGVPLGIYSAVRQYSRFDYIATTVAFIGTSMPTFFFGLMLILLFAVTPVFLEKTMPWLPSLPPGTRLAIRPYEFATWLPKVQPGTVLDRALHLAMPLGVLTLLNIAGWSRFVRASMLEVLRQDYVRTARAKGLVERLVINKHALRNALIPFVTILVLAIPGIFGGAILTETVFAWPGMGTLYVQALNSSDWNVSMALIFITAVLTVVATLLGDVLYTMVDPRIRYS